MFIVMHQHTKTNSSHAENLLGDKSDSEIKMREARGWETCLCLFIKIKKKSYWPFNNQDKFAGRLSQKPLSGEETNLIAKKTRNGETKRQNATLSQEGPEQIGSFKNSLREIPECSSRKRPVNGRAKVPAERSGLIPQLCRSLSDVPRFSLPPRATAPVEVTDSPQCRVTAVQSFKNRNMLHAHLNQKKNKNKTTNFKCMVFY